MIPDFYKNEEILKRIAFQLKGKEGAFITKKGNSKFSVRCIKAHNVSYLKKNIERFFNENMNIYYSLARYINMPMFSFNNEIRKKQYADWKKNFKMHITGFDIGLDFDNKHNLFYALKEAKKVKKLLDQYRVPNKISFSGSKGFHIEIIDSIPHNWDYEITYMNFVSFIKKLYNLSTLDETICDIRRVFKCKFSIDCNSGLVSKPLSNYDLENFDTSLFTPENVLKYGLKDDDLKTIKGNKDAFVYLFSLLQQASR